MSFFGAAVGKTVQGIKGAWSMFENVVGPAHLFGAAESLRHQTEGKDGQSVSKVSEKKESLGFTLTNRKNEKFFGDARDEMCDDDKFILGEFTRWLKRTDVHALKLLVDHTAFEYLEDKEKALRKLTEACEVGREFGHESMFACFEEMRFINSDIDLVIDITNQKLRKLFDYFGLDLGTIGKINELFAEPEPAQAGQPEKVPGVLNLKARMGAKAAKTEERPWYKFW